MENRVYYVYTLIVGYLHGFLIKILNTALEGAINRNYSRVCHISLDMNQAYGGHGLINLTDAGFSRYQLEARAKYFDCSDPMNNLWKICHERYSFQIMVF
jgi:hypothetical protein